MSDWFKCILCGVTVGDLDVDSHITSYAHVRLLLGDRSGVPRYLFRTGRPLFADTRRTVPGTVPDAKDLVDAYSCALREEYKHRGDHCEEPYDSGNDESDESDESDEDAPDGSGDESPDAGANHPMMVFAAPYDNPEVDDGLVDYVINLSLADATEHDVVEETAAIAESLDEEQYRIQVNYVHALDPGTHTPAPRESVLYDLHEIVGSDASGTDSSDSDVETSPDTV